MASFRPATLKIRHSMPWLERQSSASLVLSNAAVSVSATATAGGSVTMVAGTAGAGVAGTAGLTAAVTSNASREPCSTPAAWLCNPTGLTSAVLTGRLRLFQILQQMPVCPDATALLIELMREYAFMAGITQAGIHRN